MERGSQRDFIRDFIREGMFSDKCNAASETSHAISHGKAFQVVGENEVLSPQMPGSISIVLCPEKGREQLFSGNTKTGVVHLSASSRRRNREEEKHSVGWQWLSLSGEDVGSWSCSGSKVTATDAYSGILHCSVGLFAGPNVLCPTHQLSKDKHEAGTPAYRLNMPMFSSWVITEPSTAPRNFPICKHKKGEKMA